LLTVADGLFATNRFLDRLDNAPVLLSLIATITPPSGRIVFTEASFGNSSGSSLVGAIGPWAEAAWLQLIFLFAVVVLTLGYRFGLPREERGKERGQRELIDAVADTYLRGKMTRVALAAVYEDVNSQISRALKLPKDAPVGDRNRQLPEPFVRTLNDVLAGTQGKMRSAEATALAEKLYEQLGEFLMTRSASTLTPPAP
jgi:hypothetical protein